MLRQVMFFGLMFVSGLTKEARLVHTTQGPVVGYKEPGDNVFVFHGIPYATAPTGENKYKPPLPGPKWFKPFHAVNENISCLQMKNYLITIPKEAQTENCLVANVYVPDTKEDNLPVLVIIHGGAYIFGNGDFLKGKNLIRQRAMIIVNFNYRVGPHGFLCLGTPDVPGNAGMKDQVALLRWVQKNIASFGGNPDDVTISGFSSGSADVELLTLSLITKGLFNKAILESGSGVAAFSAQINPVKNAKDYARLLNFDAGDDVYSLEKFYKSVPNDVLYSKDVYNATNTIFFFSPCVERDVGQEIFLGDSPVNILKNGKQNKLPMLFGFTEMDGLFRIPLFDEWKYSMNTKFSNFLPGDLRFKDNAEREEVAQNVKQFYFGTQAVSEQTIFRYIDYFTDTVFAYPTLRSVRLHVDSGNENIYLYRYDFVDNTAPLVPYTCVRGADHCAQTLAVMDGVISSLAEISPSQTLNEDGLSRDYKNMKAVMRYIWATFITTGKPVLEGSIPKWPPTQANGGPYMRLDISLKLRGPLIQQRVMFWDDIYDKYYSYPYPPSLQSHTK